MLNALFILTTLVSLPYWIMLIVAPYSSRTKWLLNTHGALLFAGAVYIFALVGALVSGGMQLNFSSVEALAAMFATPAAALVMWVHLLTVDLTAAYWIRGEAELMDIQASRIRVILLLTLLFAPVGVFIFAIWRQLTNAARRADAVRAGTRQIVTH